MGNRLYKVVDFEDLKWTPLIKGCDLASLDGESEDFEGNKRAMGKV